MIWRGGMVSQTCLAVLLIIIITLGGVDSHNCEGSEALRAVEFSYTPGNAEGYYLTELDGTVLCGYIDGASAARACWDLGLNEGTDPSTRTCRCSQIPDANGDVPNIDATATYEHVTGGLTSYTCSPSADPDCLLGCIAHAPAATPTVGTDCSGAIDVLAIQCEDVDECTDGALVDCTGPFEHDCVKTYPCGPHATCNNSPSPYSCSCESGYESPDPYDLETGCTDIDECEVETNCMRHLAVFGKYAHCINTPGSYTCWCDTGFEYDSTNGCESKACSVGDLPVLDDDDGWSGSSMYGDVQTNACEGGYEASVSSPSITTTCRLDGKWCQCNFVNCKRMKCDVPPYDGNAQTAAVPGVSGDQVVYMCLEGFKSNGNADSYTLTCLSTTTDGEWTGPTNVPCLDDDECNSALACPVHSDCFNTIGSYHCICHLGYEGPTCEEVVSCGRIPDVANSYRVSEVGTVMSELDMEVDYRCEEGFQASTKHNPHEAEDQFQIKCKLDKCWSPDPIPECIPISCGDPGTVEHASRYGHSFFYKDKVSYTCYDGYLPSDYADLDASSYRTFYITCEEDGWTSKSHCVDVNECNDLRYPCGTTAEDHICVNLNGTYTCSCAYGFQRDSNGHECIKVEVPLPEDEEPEVNPCAVFNFFGFCNGGTCQLEGGKRPHCRCAPGNVGPFCDQEAEETISTPFILSAVGTTLSVFSLIVCTVLACYVCGRHCTSTDDPPRYRHSDVHADVHADVHHDVHVSGPVFRKPAVPIPTRFQPYSI